MLLLTQPLIYGPRSCTKSPAIRVSIQPEREERPSSGDTAGHRVTVLLAGRALSVPGMLCFENSHPALIDNLLFFSLFWRHNALFSLLFALAVLHLTQGSREEYDFSSFRISFVWASFLPNPQLITLRWRLPRMKEHLCACCILALTYHGLGTQLC